MRVSTYAELTTISALEDQERFDTAGRLVHEHFGALASEGLIYGAFPFGSTQFGDHNPFSDFDIAVAIEDHGVDGETESFRAIHAAAKDVYRRTAIPLEVTCNTTAQLTEGLHNGFPRNMLDWLKEQRQLYPESVIGGDFVPHIRQAQVRRSPFALEGANDYIANVRHLLKKNWMQGCYFRPHDLLGIVFSVPHVAGRKAIDALQTHGLIDIATMPDLCKETIANAVHKTFGASDTKLWELYANISSDFALYKTDFAPAAKLLTQDEHDQIITETLEDTLPKAIEFLRRLQLGYRFVHDASPFMQVPPTTTYTEKGSNLTPTAIEDRIINEYRLGQMDSM